MKKEFVIISFLMLFAILITSFVFAHNESYDSLFSAITGFATESNTTTVSSTTSTGMTGTTIALITIDVIGILIGFMLLTFLLTSLEPFRGPLRTSYIFMGWGVLSQLLALVYTIIFVRLKLAAVPFGLDIHHLLMTLGIVLFAFSVYNLREVVKGASNA